MKPRTMTIDGDKLVEAIGQMAVMADQLNSLHASVVRVTMMMHELCDIPAPAHLAKQMSGEA